MVVVENYDGVRGGRGEEIRKGWGGEIGIGMLV